MLRHPLCDQGAEAQACCQLLADLTGPVFSRGLRCGMVARLSAGRFVLHRRGGVGWPDWTSIEKMSACFSNGLASIELILWFRKPEIGFEPTTYW